MPRNPPGGRRKRVAFRPNRQAKGRAGDWTKRLQRDAHALADAESTESVRAKGELSRKRTVIVNERDAPAVDASQWLPGVATHVHGLICHVDDDAGRSWSCTVRRVLRTLRIEQRSPVVAGDRVWFSDHSRLHDGEPAGVIERVEPRRTVLSRGDSRGREHAIVANADQLLIVASVSQPRLKPHLIDRYLVAAGKGGLRPILCLNKVDLVERAISDEDDAPLAMTLDDVIAEFRGLGYRVLATSIVSGAGLAELAEELRGHSTVLSGQSGVGKSSLLNAIQPGLGLNVADVSEENQKGRHTTTTARLLRLDLGGYVVDTPGIRQFGLWAVEPGELEALFIEFAPLVSECRFRDCHHGQEEGCAIVAAVESGRISRRRYRSYLKTLEELARAGAAG